jgi:hypothetical protein
MQLLPISTKSCDLESRSGRGVRLVYRCLTPLSTIFQLYRGGQFLHAFLQSSRSHLGRERMLVELITIYAIIAYQHKKL